MTTGRIRIGTGGWSFPPWRDNFYPKGLAQARELEYASRKLTSIEINATYHRLQKPESFAKWRDSTPDDFMFSVKASMYSTNRRVLAEAGESIERFMASGLSELGEKLGPIVWQFMPTKVFDADDFGAFLALLPTSLSGKPLRHAVEVRHSSFLVPGFVALAKRYRVAIVFADSDTHPSFADSTGDFIYGRLMKTVAEESTGYAPERIAFWASAARTWSAGSTPSRLPTITTAVETGSPRDVFLYFISGAKERAPAAAVATIGALSTS